MKALSNYLARIDPKDRRALLLLSAFIGVVVIVWGVTLPTYHSYKNSKAEMVKNKELSQWVRSNASKVKPAGEQKERPEGSLLEWVTNTAASNELTISRFQPEGESKVRIWLNDADYQKVNALLQQLIQDFGVEIEALIIDRTSIPGLVNVQCTLS